MKWFCAHLSETGAAALEFASVAPLLFILIFGGIDLSRLMYHSSALHFALSSGLRWGILGETVRGLGRSESIETVIIDIGSRYKLELTPNLIHICSGTALDCTTDNAGNPGEIILVRATKQVDLFFGMMVVNISSSVFGKNEQYV